MHALFLVSKKTTHLKFMTMRIDAKLSYSVFSVFSLSVSAYTSMSNSCLQGLEFDTVGWVDALNLRSWLGSSLHCEIPKALPGSELAYILWRWNEGERRESTGDLGPLFYLSSFNTAWSRSSFLLSNSCCCSREVQASTSGILLEMRSLRVP